MPKIKAVVFDMDGVLLDTESMSDRNWYQAATEMGISKNDIGAALEACRGSNSRHIEEELNRRFGTVPGFTGAKFLQRTGELFHELEVTEGIPLMKGAQEILVYLKEKGYPLALASSTRGEAVKRQMKNAGLIDFFDVIITGDMVYKSKPDPEIYLTACSKLGVPSQTCAGVEDSLNGVRSTAAAGMFAVMVPDKVQPTEEIKALLFKLCGNLLELKTFL
ncbi:MAG: HAD family phosphatase [Treponemataceae bacterium]|nr:HAD family phosphatase [Treponemataceae bacterium]